MDGGGHVHHPSRHYPGEDLREPKEQSRAADYCHPPEYREVVELLPIRPAPVLRARPAAQEPFQRPAELLPVAPLEQHALRAGQELPPALAAPPPLPHQVAQVQSEEHTSELQSLRHLVC